MLIEAFFLLFLRSCNCVGDSDAPRFLLAKCVAMDGGLGVSMGKGLGVGSESNIFLSVPSSSNFGSWVEDATGVRARFRWVPGSRLPGG